MTKKTKRIVYAIIILLIIAIAIFAFLKVRTNNVSEEKISDASEEEEDAAFAAYEMTGDSSLDLIDIALAEKKIDRETALIYKMYAVFGDDKLPQEYTSDVTMLNANEAFIEIREAFDSLSPETQETLSPFLKRPEDPGSYYNLNYEKIVSKKSADTIMSRIIPAAQARSGVDNNLYCSTCILPTANGRAKIWYPDVDINAPEAEYGDLMVVDQATLYSMAERLQTILNNDRIYERFTDLLQREPDNDGTLGGDDALDIYVGPLNVRAAAVAVSDTGSFPSSAYIIMNAGWFNFDNFYKTTLAHEMFHVFQYSYTWSLANSRWWAEATAVWSEDFIYKGFNSEQRRLKHFLPYPNKTVYDNQPNPFKYGAYIFPYFLTQNSGNQTVRNIWEDCNYSGCLDAIDDNISDGFKGQWKEFTLWNYNIKPVRFYTDEGGFSTLSSSKNIGDIFLAGDDTISVPEIKPLSAQVLRFSNLVDTNTYKQLIFKDIKDFTSLSDKTGLKAVIYLKDHSTKIEDWTELEERTFCLVCEENNDECVEEKLDFIVLIFSNADKTSSLPSSEIETEGKEEACTGSWYGTIKVHETMTISAPFVGTIVESWDATIKEELEQVHVGKKGAINPKAALSDSTIDLEFHVMKQDIKYNYKETSPYHTTTGSGETKREHPHPESRGSLINDDTELDTVVRMMKKKKYEGVQTVLGQGEWIFNDAEQMYGECEFVTLSTGETDCPEYFSCGDSDGQFIGRNLDGYVVEPTDNGTRIKGSDTYSYSFMGANITTNLEWDYRKR